MRLNLSIRFAVLLQWGRGHSTAETGSRRIPGTSDRGFNEIDESELLIEVKTTGLGKYSPFYVTANELRCSEDVGPQFNLFRVFSFGWSPRAYVLTGSLRVACRLEQVQYRATIS